MKHISIIVPKGDFILSSVLGAYKVFNAANDHLLKTGKTTTPFFKIDLVGISEETSLYNGLFTIKPNKNICEIDKTDIVIISTIYGNLEKSISINKPFISWIKMQHNKNQAEIASLCTGSFLLAETGLANGKSCATHWAYADAFAKKYPKTNVQSDKIIVDSNGIYSSGGAYSFLNLILYLVEKHTGKETALWCSKLLEIDYNRTNQNQFFIFKGQKDHGDTAIIKAQNFIEANFTKKLIVEEIAEKFAISTRNFVRRFKKATNNTPIEYIQRVKIEAAKEQLETTELNINEIMFNVGYIDSKSFRNLFRKITGILPLEYKLKYNRQPF